VRPGRSAIEALPSDVLPVGASGSGPTCGLSDRRPDPRLVLVSGRTDDDAVCDALRSRSMRFPSGLITIEADAGDLRAEPARSGGA
jgi:hypothetical protein